MGGRWSKLAFDPPIPCLHPDKKKIARGACNACYQKWKREMGLPKVPVLTPEDRQADACRIVDALYATCSTELLGYIGAELTARFFVVKTTW